MVRPAGASFCVSLRVRPQRTPSGGRFDSVCCLFLVKQCMPTVLRSDGYRFFFYSSDRAEPMHVHVEQAGHTAKIWLRPIRLVSSHGFSRSELNKVVNVVTSNQALPLESWNEFFSDEE